MPPRRKHGTDTGSVANHAGYACGRAAAGSDDQDVHASQLGATHRGQQATLVRHPVDNKDHCSVAPPHPDPANQGAVAVVGGRDVRHLYGRHQRGYRHQGKRQPPPPRQREQEGGADYGRPDGADLGERQAGG
jgi:hypothetical protein